MTATVLEWPTLVGIAMDRRVAEKLAPELSSERLDRQWRGVEARISGGLWPSLGLSGARPLYAGLALAAAAALVLVMTLGRPSPSASAVEGGSFSNPSAGPAELSLVDGSKLQVSPSGRVDFQALGPESVRLVLTRGWVELDVAHVANRRFVVQAGSVDVVVRGTHFRVELGDADPQVVSVAVTRGAVEVLERHTGSLAKRLGAGMSWTMGKRAAVAEPSAATPAPTPAEAVATPSATPTAAAAPGSDTFDELYRARKLKQAYDALGDAGFARAVESSGAKRLLELADAARLSGHPRQAATALDSLRKRYRSDARAGLAALELGRLRLDSFGDPAGALEALRDAQALSRSASVQEDALARQAQALEALGNDAGCRRVRADYLKRYPSGIHSASIARRCGGQ
jgi:transmembrane sensor